MELPVIPAANGVLPRIYGGLVHGAFLDQFTSDVIRRTEPGGDILLCPWINSQGELYPVGVVARILKVWTQNVTFTAGPGAKSEHTILLAALEGREYAKAVNFCLRRRLIVTEGLTILDLKKLRPHYPAIAGAGWKVLGGFTEMCSPHDIGITIYGREYMTGREVRLQANMGGLVTGEQAHTVEHAIIRALAEYGLCTPKTLIAAVEAETTELKQSVELGFKHVLPEAFGVTQSGVCGNPLTQLAQFYLTREFAAQLEEGRGPWDSLSVARRKAMSRLTENLELTSTGGLRILQSLKKGMLHDDSPLTMEKSKKILNRFPVSPWG